jgi:hypothetical protein
MDNPSLILMGFNSKYYGVLAIGLGIYAIVKRNIGLGPSASIRPQFYVTGFPAVLLGIALVGLGLVMMLIRR